MISPASDTRTSSLPMSASSSSRPRTNSSRITWSSNSKAESTASPRPAASWTLATPMDDPRLAGFTKMGSPSAADRLFHHLGRPRGAGHHPPRRHGQAVVVQHGLGDPLVHADRGGEHAGSDVGDLQCLEVSLDHAVLAERTVEHREHDGVGWQAVVEVCQRERRDDGGPGRRGRSSASTPVDVGEHPSGVDQPLVVRQSDRRHHEPGLERGAARCGAPRCTTPRARPTGPRRRPPALPDQASTEAIQSAARAMRAILHI